jgi:hypothetical protein
MAKVQGVKEKLHSPLYDAFFVDAKASSPKNTFQGAMTDPRMIRFFVDVQNKTKLETNLQAAGVLPSLNTFEARALRVVVSSLHRFNPADCDPKNELKAERNEAEVLADLIYNSVISLIVGEKTMIEMPTFWFPSGAGVSPGFSTISNHGLADPTATFRFAEPVYIEPQQNFRVEMAFPQGIPGQQENTAYKLANTPGPFRIWVVLDGYLTRDVQ